MAFGEAWAAKDYRAGDVRRELNSLAGEVFARRRESAGRVKDFLRQQVRPGNRALRWVPGGPVCSCTWAEVPGFLEAEGDCSALRCAHLPGVL